LDRVRGFAVEAKNTPRINIPGAFQNKAFFSSAKATSSSMSAVAAA